MKKFSILFFAFCLCVFDVRAAVLATTNMLYTAASEAEAGATNTMIRILSDGYVQKKNSNAIITGTYIGSGMIIRDTQYHELLFDKEGITMAPGFDGLSYVRYISYPIKSGTLVVDTDLNAMGESFGNIIYDVKKSISTNTAAISAEAVTRAAAVSEIDLEASSNAAAISAEAVARAAGDSAGSNYTDSAVSPAVAKASEALAIAQTYMLASNAWLTVSNSVLSLYKVDDTGHTGAVVWASSEVKAGIDASATNALWRALASANSAIAGKADVAWGTSTPLGDANPDPAFQVLLNTPAVTFASGCTWESSGAYAVLLTAGTVAYASGTNGSFRIGNDSTNFFGYTTGGSVIVGAVPESFSTTYAGTSNGFATAVYDYQTGNDFPVMWYTPTLSAIDWQQVSGVVWVDNTNGTATVTVPATQSTGFWRATTTAKLGAVFESTMPAQFKGGIYGTLNSSPVVFDSTITVKDVNGVSYRIPAQKE